MVGVNSIIRLKESDLRVDIKIISDDVIHPIEDPFEYKGKIVNIEDDNSEGVTASQIGKGNKYEGDEVVFDEDDIETVVEE